MLNILLFPYKLIFYYPARIILWINYFFPKKGKKGGFISVAESRRQYKEGGYLVHFIVSCMMWGSLVLALSLGI